MMILITTVCIASYIILILWLSDSVYKYSKKKNEIKQYNNPLVSIIISAHNEEKHINSLLNSLINQSYNQKLYEIILIDDRSNDNTSKLISNFVNKNIKLIKINDTPIGWSHKKWALNSGINKAEGEIILQTDADCIPNQYWIETMVNAFTEKNVGFVCGPSPLYSKNKIEYILQLENNAQDAISASGLENNIILSCTGRNLGFLKKKFMDINGYENIEHLESGDDDLLMHKMNKHTKYKLKFILDENASVYSYPPNSINQFIKQRLRFASKGIFYYKWKADLSLRIFLPFLYITNLIISISLIQFTSTSNALLLLPWLFKSLSDCYLTYNYCQKINQPWSVYDCLILSIIHPFYVVIFGALGPLLKVKWK